MSNNNLIPFKKVWNYKNDGKYGEKDYWFNPAVEIRGIEPCKIQKDGKEVDCVKIFYPQPDGYITLLGSLEDFTKKCRDSNITICLLTDLFNAGYTIKQFMEQTGKLNDVQLM